MQQYLVINLLSYRTRKKQTKLFKSVLNFPQLFNMKNKVWRVISEVQYGWQFGWRCQKLVGRSAVATRVQAHLRRDRGLRDVHAHRRRRHLALRPTLDNLGNRRSGKESFNLTMYNQTLANDHLQITTTCLQRPLFWGPILNFLT